jgi:hypothetical protein
MKEAGLQKNQEQQNFGDSASSNFGGSNFPLNTLVR